MHIAINMVCGRQKLNNKMNKRKACIVEYKLLKCGCGGKTRTCDLWVMSSAFLVLCDFVVTFRVL